MRYSSEELIEREKWLRSLLLQSHSHNRNFINCYLCLYHVEKSMQAIYKYMLKIYITISSFCLLIIAHLYLCLLLLPFANFWHCNSNREHQRIPPISYGGEAPSQVKIQELLIFNFEKLVTATNSFHPSNRLGQGGFGPVYKLFISAIIVNRFSFCILYYRGNCKMVRKLQLKDFLRHLDKI
ncbi:G-type lectin S-receptor-like serine/threonine-protein kinase, partial [Mucuna pruriens]